MKIHADQNFCRVFEMPLVFSSGFLFSGGKDTVFKMVDWFNPIPPDILEDFVWDEWASKLENFILEKNYVKEGKKYVCITDFNKAIVIQRV